jgi:hypothetical protein
MWTQSFRPNPNPCLCIHHQQHLDSKSYPPKLRRNLLDELKGHDAKLSHGAVRNSFVYDNCNLHGYDSILQHTPADFLVGNYRHAIVARKYPFYSRQNPSMHSSCCLDDDAD